MVYEARPGQTFLLGASTWRIEEIGRDRVIVTPAPGLPGAVPFWKGDGVGRPKELGEAIGAFARWAVERPREELERDYALDVRAADNLLDFLSEQQAVTRVVPSDRAIVIERFRDEIGDWRLCVLSPFGGRVHSAWALALSARIRDELGLESDAIYSDDGIIVHLPDSEDPPDAELVLLDPDEVEDRMVAELGSSALFGARFRENAARALLIPRARPGKRTPLWQQRLKSQSLLEVAKKFDDFPIVLETYRECLRDVLDVPGLVDLLTRIHRREVSLVEVETPTASPFASSLLFDYVATYMYEGDTPNAERRAAALSLDRDLLRELLGQEELRELIDPDALAEVEADLQRLSDRTRAPNADSLHDVLRAVGDLTTAEAQAHSLEAVSAKRMVEQLKGERRAALMRIGGEERWIAAEDAGLYRDALGAVPPGGLPETFLEPVEEPLTRLVRRYARTHGPFTTAELGARYRVDPSPVLRELEPGGEVVWVGAGALGRHSGKIALYFRDDARWLGPPPNRADPPGEPLHDAIRARLERGASFWTDLIADLAEVDAQAVEPVELQEALWDLVWAGEVSNDAFAPLRAPKLALAKPRTERERSAGRRFGRRRRPSAPQIQGRWSLTAPLFADAPAHGPRKRAIAELLLERYGIVTRETVLAEGIPGGFSGLYDELSKLETLGTARRGYFVEGLGGAQFALAAAIERLRGLRADEPT